MTSSTPSKKQPNILIIEDDRDQQKMYAYAFHEAGYNVLQEESGEQGLESAFKSEPDLIILDLLLGGIDGIETLKRLKANKTTADIPVVVLTNFTKEDTLQKARDLGARDIIIKTNIIPRDLVELVKNKYLKE